MTNGDPMLPEPMRVIAFRRETPDTFTLRLDATARGGFNFSPGQFNMLFAFGVGEVPISIASDPKKTRELVHTVRAVGAVTRALGRVRRGAFVGVRGPFGTAWPLEYARGKDVVVIGGGVGLAPLKSVIESLLRNRRDYARISVIAGARTPADLLYRRELTRWRAKLDVDVELIVDRADAEWRGHTGVVTKLISRLDFDPQRTVALMCGPELMMRAAARELERLGVSDRDVFVSLERNMRCGIGHCGHCQLGPLLLCRDGPVLSYERAASLLAIREL